MFELSLFYVQEILTTYNKTLSDYISMPTSSNEFNINLIQNHEYEKNKFIREQKTYLQMDAKNSSTKNNFKFIII